MDYGLKGKLTNSYQVTDLFVYLSAQQLELNKIRHCGILPISK